LGEERCKVLRVDKLLKGNEDHIEMWESWDNFIEVSGDLVLRLCIFIEK
jgi:hypothetical protein